MHLLIPGGVVGREWGVYRRMREVEAYGASVSR